MALQLRYFTPSLRHRPQDHTDNGEISGITAGYSKVATQLLRLFGSSDAEHDLEEAERRLDEEDGGRRRHLSRHSTAVSIEASPAESEDSSSSQQQSLTAYRLVAYILIKARLIMASLWHLIWRFSQLHAHKAAVLVLFAISLYEISAAYLILLFFLVVITPLPVLNRLTYPIITLLLGGLALAKAVYQLPMISVPQLTIGDCIDNVSIR